jgi:pteridine reductase
MSDLLFEDRAILVTRAARQIGAAPAPDSGVNGLALGATLPPGKKATSPDILRAIPAGSWRKPHEVQSTRIFLLAGPAYITGEIVLVNGSRHAI